MHISWSADKNIWLQHHRGIGFEDILDAIDHGGLVNVLDHHNKIDYPEQKILIVHMNMYTYQVPCIITEDKMNLITIFPSRKYKKFI